METEPNKLLSGRMAGDRQYTWHRWCDLLDVALQEEYRVSNKK